MKKIEHGKKWMPAMYVAYFGILQELANAHGYALCVHGSVVRDFDLIAVPFDVEVKPHQELLSAIRKAVGVQESTNPVFDIVGYEPHGRTCYTIECGAGGYFDISFTPTMQEAMAMVQKQIQDKKDIQELLEKSRQV
jgi:hypothetical protein